VFAEHWIFPLLGVPQYRTERRGDFANLAALVTWVVTLVSCLLVLGEWLGVHLFFLWPPGYLLALVLYTIIVRLQRDATAPQPETVPAGSLEGPPPLPRSMPLPGGGDGTRPRAGTIRREPLPLWRRLARGTALASVVAIVGLALARALGGMGPEPFRVAVGALTLAWFASAPLWLTPGLFGLGGPRPASPSSGAA
jgi:hypothetical protein